MTMRGNINCEEPKELVKRFIKFFGLDNIDCLGSDKELVRQDWIVWSKDYNLRYQIRIRQNFWISNQRSGQEDWVRHLFNWLPAGEELYYHPQSAVRTYKER